MRCHRQVVRRRWQTAAAVLISASLLAAPALVDAQTSCSITRNRLTQDTNQFSSDCGYTGFCGQDNICHPNGCRRDEYPFGYDSRSEWPPMCGEGQFCPDELDACQNKLPLGAACQLNRDDECADPPADLKAQKVESICLKFTCQYKNVTEGQACINENTVYTIYESPVLNYGDIVSRDNCNADNYCNAATAVCRAKKNIAELCAADKECNSYRCADDTGDSPDQMYDTDQNGRCAQPPNIPSRPGPWVYVVVALGVVIGGVGLCLGLFLIHSKGRMKRNKEISQYHTTQARLRAEILDVYENAKLLVGGGGAAAGGGYGSREALIGKKGGGAVTGEGMMQQSDAKTSGINTYPSQSSAGTHHRNPLQHWNSNDSPLVS